MYMRMDMDMYKNSISKIEFSNRVWTLFSVLSIHRNPV